MPSQDTTNGSGSRDLPLHSSQREADTLANTTWRDATLSGDCGRTSLLNILDPSALSSSRNCGQAFNFLRRCTGELIKSYETRPIPFSSDATLPLIDIARPEQFGDLLYIPKMRGGEAFIVSDIEGDVNLVQEIFRKERILERLAQNNSDEQVFFISLGDAIDRQGYRASETLEFLLNLKFEYGFRDNIHILAGNHELSPDIQLDDRQGGFFKEVVDYRPSYSIPGDLSPEFQDEAISWFNNTFADKLSSTAAPYRVALWLQFNELFSYLPKTIVTANGLVLCHGGPTDTGAFSFLYKPNVWPRPTFQQGITWLTGIPFDVEHYTEAEREELTELYRASVEDITWSDWHPHLEGTEPNMSRRFNERGERLPLGLYYGSKALEQYLSVLGAQVMIRGHQKAPADGAKKHSANVWSASNSLLTINSTVISNEWADQGQGGAEEILVKKRGYLKVSLGKTIRGIDDITLHEL